jgi:hypothetical protein
MHYVDSEGQLRAQHDGLPLGGTLTTDLWVPGEIVSDEYTLDFAEDLPAGQCELRVGMYLQETGERIPVVQNGMNIAERLVTIETYVGTK